MMLSDNICGLRLRRGFIHISDMLSVIQGKAQSQAEIFEGSFRSVCDSFLLSLEDSVTLGAHVVSHTTAAVLSACSVLERDAHGGTRAGRESPVGSFVDELGLQ